MSMGSLKVEGVDGTGGAIRSCLRLMAASATILLGGCMPGPRYGGPPVIAMADKWSQQVEMVGTLDLSEWWHVFQDPTLDRLMELALARNLDLQQAGTRIAQARAASEAASGGFYPSVGISASTTLRRQSENGALPINSIPGIERDQTLNQTGFDASWELDLFGRLRNQVSALESRLEAAEDDARAARLSLAAEVARTYFEFRGSQRTLVAQNAALAILLRTGDIDRQRVSLGDLPAEELATVDAGIAAARAELPRTQAAMRNALFALGVLLARPPEAELALLESEPVPVPISALPVDGRADMLRRRPDIRAAERRLRASSAETGIALAEYFPRLTISAQAGFEALSDRGLFDEGSQEGSIVPLITWRLLDGGQIAAEVRVSRAREREASLAYEAAVLNALADTERGLNEDATALAAASLSRDARLANERFLAFAGERFRAGDVSRKDVLDAERRLLDAQIQEAQYETAALVARVSLFKALGGGWTEQSLLLEPEIDGRLDSR